MTTKLELEMSFGGSVLDGCENALLVDNAHTLGRDLHGNPHVLLGNVELLGLQVGSKGSLGMDAGMGHVVARYHFLTGDFTLL